ncbi:DUF4097 family beta strand repeat-containing protein [Halostella litorea]|uniref:DUF4097 family beta strand repeat-containing protein n=1 Tax=Halostella litorea TaxID=2528831 RepID=UPI0010922940|nr:DUF4097 family beta strand repeat-containing protein [Halostella litorea]
MSDTLTRRTLLAGGVTAALGGLAGCISTSREAEETVTETMAVDDANALVVEGAVGDVSVSGEARDDVRVEGTKRAAGEDGLDRVDVRVERSGGRITVTVDRETENGLLRLSPSPIAVLDIAVPEAFQVADVSADTADVGVDGVAGPTELKTDTGDIRATAVDGDLTTRSDTGDQRVNVVSGRLHATVDTGDVGATGVNGLGDIEADTGDVEVTAATVGGNASVEADTGDVSLAFTEAINAAVTVTSDTGDIVVENLGEVDRVETENSFEATVGEGTHSLTVRTDTGDVTLTGGS